MAAHKRKWSAKKSGARTGKRKATRGNATKPSLVKRARKRFTPAERAHILSVARAEGLTGAKVAKRFGISTLTYYTWRKKSAALSTGTRKVGRPARAAGDLSLVDMIRREVRAQLVKHLPEIIESEIGGVVARSIGGRNE